MSFACIVDRDTFLAELQACASSIGKIPATVPILSNVMLRPNGDALRIAMTDLLSTPQSECPTKRLAGRGAILVDSAKLLSIFRHLPDESVNLEQQVNGALQIVSGSAEFEIPTAPTDLYPTLPSDTEAEREAALDADVFVRMLRATSYAGAGEEAGFRLDGVSVSVGGGEIAAAATDGRRMAVATAAMGGTLESFMVKKPVAQALAKWVPGSDGLTIGQSANHIFFRAGHRTLAMRRDDHNFPDYSKWLKAGELELMVDRERLVAAIERVVVLSVERLILLDVEAGRLTISAVTTQGRAADALPIDYAGKPFRYKIIASYFVDALKALDSASVSCNFSEDFTSTKAMHVYPIVNEQEAAPIEIVGVMAGVELTPGEMK